MLATVLLWREHTADSASESHEEFTASLLPGTVHTPPDVRAAPFSAKLCCLAHVKLTQLPAAGANNYLGLSNHPRLVAAAHAALDEHGFGLSSVRFICGTQARTSLLHHLDLKRLLCKHHSKQ